ncbi:glycosyltransferase family A protein [Salinimicrobium sp. MT39]|uniref:Glycosyltransferase family A protein n=1 Tax=Salinimicrobium profundisediminis TaxID=2994553 RepID=A0A9X3CXV1_9FLAO|nr:glycosyltransferase family A protein [Salinimicrobium profundisediminis]MCX2837489.1 glycosyltransferase family A protein [Salinimicrobium profundisediminis]
MEYPIVSIIVPCFNHARYLDEALASVRQQTFSNWECIIVNDGSPDNTEEIAQSWVAKDGRFRYLYQLNKGVSSARNFGIFHSNGDFILPLDADDKISKEYIRLAMDAFRQEPDLTLVYSEAETFGTIEEKWKLQPFSLNNLARFNMIFCSAVFKKQDWCKIGGYDENMAIGLEDWDFWISLLKNGGKVKKLKEVCFFYRIKKVSRNTQISQNKQKKMFQYLSVKHAHFYVEQLGSFQKLIETVDRIKYENKIKLKSEKFVINLFFRTFFGFSIFKDKWRN